jgi:hypothetical protein
MNMANSTAATTQGELLQLVGAVSVEPIFNKSSCAAHTLMCQLTAPDLANNTIIIHPLALGDSIIRVDSTHTREKDKDSPVLLRTDERQERQFRSERLSPWSRQYCQHWL